MNKKWGGKNLRTKIRFKYTHIPHFTMLGFVALCRYRIVLQIAVLWQPCDTRSISAIFPAAFAHCVSLCHILVVFQTFSLLWYLLW